MAPYDTYQETEEEAERRRMAADAQDAALDLRAQDNSKITNNGTDALGTNKDMNAFHGQITGGAKNASLQETEKAELHSQKAMELLRSAILSNPEVSPQQALAAGILAIMPTIGGYMAGRATGSVKLSPHARATQEELIAADPNHALAEGAKLGLDTSEGYLESMRKLSLANQQQQIDINKAMANEEFKREDRADANARDYNKMALEKDMEVQMMPLREASQIRVAGAEGASALNRQKALIDYEVEKGLREKPFDVNKELADNPTAKAAYDKIASGADVTKEDYALLSPKAIESASRGLRSSTYASGLEFNKDQRKLNNYESLGAPLTTAEKQKIEFQNEGLARTKAEMLEFIANPDSFTGNSSAIQAALSGMMTNAQRMATNSGANFTATEIDLVKKALPATLAGDPVRAIKEAMLGRDQKVFARDLIDLFDRVNDYALLEAYKQKREDKDLSYYPEYLVKRVMGDKYIAPTPTQTKTDNDPLGIR